MLWERYAPRLRCCFDPCNLLLTEFSPESVPAIVDAVASDDVSMIHLEATTGSADPA